VLHVCIVSLENEGPESWAEEGNLNVGIPLCSDFCREYAAADYSDDVHLVLGSNQ
jgi:hypothetical protein